MIDSLIFRGKVFRIGDTVTWTENKRVQFGIIKEFLKIPKVSISIKGKRGRVLPISQLTLIIR